MALSDAENTLYQNILKPASELSLNLMAVKVDERPETFLLWCKELYRLCRDGINFDLLEPEQLVPLKKMQDLLIKGISYSQVKMLRIAPWPVFYDFVMEQREQQVLDERLSLLDFVATLLDKPLAEMNELDLFTYVGKHTPFHDPSIYQFDVEWFGGTKGAKVFQQLLVDNPNLFDQALSHIPLEGEVKKQDYDKFVAAYQAIFHSYTELKPAGEKAPVVPATRLLAMRRPDQFVVLTAAKIDIYCQGLSVAKFNNYDFDGYWQDLIETIRTTSWWRQSMPEDESEQHIWKYRVALMDVFLFASDNLAEQSNFSKLKTKIANQQHSKSTSRATARRRTKESAEMLVDRRLAEDDIPEYLLGKRDSLVNEVKNGKSVDEAISLFRAIFG